MSRVLWFTYAASWSRSLVRGELPIVLKEVDTADELSRGRWRALGVFEWCARSCSSPRLECTRSRQVAWKGRDSNPRPRHDELAAPLKIAFIFNTLPRSARCNWHHEAQPSTTDSRRPPSAVPSPDATDGARRPRRSHSTTRAGREAAFPDGRCAAARGRRFTAAPNPRVSARAERG